ncbi:MAG TPA: hypothetical protein VFJ16_04155 [Longimicrobium sp.]|nr:hypothetical protein [Longimicrobium sp.]
MKHVLTLGAAVAALMLGAATAAAQTDTAHVAAAADSAAPAAAARPRRSANVLTADEIVATHESNLYQVVARLRSRWLRDRPGDEHDDAGPVTIQVYRNGSLLGDVDALRQIAPTDVAAVEWLAPIAAKVKFGPRAGHGAILVTDKH